MHGGRWWRPGLARAFVVWGILVGPAAAASPAERLVEAAGPARVVLVGERHRQPAGHRLFVRVVAGYLDRGERVAAGLEIPADRQERLDAAVAGTGPAGGVAPVVVDGPSYRTLLGRLGGLARQHPGRLAVLALDAPAGPGAARDRTMASGVLDALARGTDRVVVLVGNLHALKAAPGAPTLGGLLVEAGVAVASVVAGPGGGSWRWAGPAEPEAARLVASLWALRAGTLPAVPPARVVDGVFLAAPETAAPRPEPGRGEKTGRNTPWTTAADPR